MRQLVGERRILLTSQRKYISLLRAMMLTETERYYVRIGSRMYAVDSDTVSHAVIEVLAGIGDPDTWPSECLVWNERYYRERYGEPAEVIQL